MVAELMKPHNLISLTMTNMHELLVLINTNHKKSLFTSYNFMVTDHAAY